VTQQDASTSTTIAREAKADGNSMKVIAALTMVFLPGTFLSSVFGMAALNNAHWWLYVALTLPLTFLVLVTWWLWVTFPNNVLGSAKNKSSAGNVSSGSAMEDKV
jgi:protein-S-isoprenylcysteine O-methyltransferase Ste14